MRIPKFLYLLYSLISSPRNTWQELSTDINEQSEKEDNKFFYKMLSICFLGALIGDIVYESEKTIIASFLNAVLLCVAFYSSLWLIIFIFREFLCKKFRILFDKIRFFRLLKYSISLTLLTSTIVSIFPGLFFLKIINIYTIYIVWEGVDKMTFVSERNKSNFVLILSLLIIVLPIIVYHFLLLFIKI